MTKEQAIEWLRGIRDMGNLVTHEPHNTWNVRVEQANAAMLQQAYWVLKAHKEGLLQINDEPYGTCSFCSNDGPITKDPDGLMCDRCWKKD